MTKSDKIRARIARADTNLRYAQVDTYLTSIALHRRATTHTTVYVLPGNVHATLTEPHGNRSTMSSRELRALDKHLKEAGL